MAVSAARQLYHSADYIERLQWCFSGVTNNKLPEQAVQDNSAGVAPICTGGKVNPWLGQNPFEKEDVLIVYTDGSFRNERTAWGFVGVYNDVEIYRDGGIIEGEATQLRQITGELKAVMEAVVFAKKNQMPLVIVCDYTGIIAWVQDYISRINADNIVQPPQLTAWKTKNVWTKSYRDFMIKNKDVLVGMKEVRSHKGAHLGTDHFWNDVVDKIVQQLTA